MRRPYPLSESGAGSIAPQAQSESDTPDRDVTRTFIGDAPSPSNFTTPIDDHESTEPCTPSGTALRLRRVLHPAANGVSLHTLNVVGDVTGSRQMPDGTHERAAFPVLHTGTSA